jgi:hypothetical protein
MTIGLSPAALSSEVRRTSIAVIAGHLQTVLSRRVTAYVVGLREAKGVTRWASGEVEQIQSPEMEKRLRAAYEISRILENAGESAESIKSWFIGYDHSLRDSPADAIREGHISEAYDLALSSAAN